MTDMEFKGITWVGNVYQKFETLCLEAEEVMYQDTVNFVGSQVQTVSSSVKKFYADVMEDLLPPSSIGTTKVQAPDFSLNPNVVEIKKKTKVSNEEDSLKVYKEATDDSEEIVGLNVNGTSYLNKLCDVNRTQRPDSDEEISDYIDFKIKINSRNKNHHEMKTSSAPLSKDFKSASSCYEKSENIEEACERKTVISETISVEVAAQDSAERGRICSGAVETTSSTTAASTDFPIYNVIQSTESSGKRRPKLSCASSIDEPGTLSAESYENSRVDSPLGSRVTGDTRLCEDAERSEHIDMIENNDAVEPGEQTNEQFDQLAPEETCVLVDADRLFCLPPKGGKHRSYKKKLKEAFSSRKKLVKEYEQLATRYIDVDEGSDQDSAEGTLPLATYEDAKTLPAHDLSESEWELL